MVAQACRGAGPSARDGADNIRSQPPARAPQRDRGAASSQHACRHAGRGSAGPAPRIRIDQGFGAPSVIVWSSPPGGTSTWVLLIGVLALGARLGAGGSMVQL